MPITRRKLIGGGFCCRCYHPCLITEVSIPAQSKIEHFMFYIQVFICFHNFVMFQLIEYSI
jgi:hypothetical protein